MQDRTSIKAKLYRRLNKNLGDFNVNLCMTIDFDDYFGEMVSAC